MTQTIVNLGTGGAVLNGRNGSTTSADSNDALFLDWTGLDYVYLPGVPGNDLTVPDAAALDITGDIDIRVQVAMDDWTPASQQVLVGKQLAGSDKAFRLSVETTGNLSFLFSTNGTTDIVANSGAATNITDLTAKWVRVVRSGSTVLFYLSDDGATWTQLGSTVTGLSTSNIFNSTQPLQVGSFGAAGNGAMAGVVYRAEVYNGVAGTKVLDIDTSVITSGAATSFTALTGQTVTIRRAAAGRKTVAVVSPVWLFGTDDYMEVADNALLNFGATDSFTVVAVMRQWATQPSFVRYLTKANNVDVGYGIIHFNTTTGAVYFVDDGPSQISGDLTLGVGVVSTVAGVVNRAAQTLTSYTNNAATSPASIASLGSLSNSLPFRIGADSAGLGSHTNFELLAVAMFRRALTATEISRITAYYQARLS